MSGEADLSLSLFNAFPMESNLLISTLDQNKKFAPLDEELKDEE
jgi:hypothetical protein